MLFPIGKNDDQVGSLSPFHQWGQEAVRRWCWDTVCAVPVVYEEDAVGVEGGRHTITFRPS